MINERIALVMLNGEVPGRAGDPHHTKQYYHTIQDFAYASALLCEKGQFKKLEEFLWVAWKLFKEGNETVKSGIVNVFLFTLSRAMDQHPNAKKNIEPFMPGELRLEYARMLYAPAV
ncbi:DUF7674 family protein [Chryseosolibacter indicus]|uniref:DUF7674 domain-containing protein n=1 Tax=Chryseosolibacter indicus TaxID=2782351 RepID=A0ABS5VYJ4_9BACT|nr:hypothetical protein [Chryseosolibacter indicus]MBT1706470.1 hypothetical protein [Chryseosolibacter indicus]